MTARFAIRSIWAGVALGLVGCTTYSSPYYGPPYGQPYSPNPAQTRVQGAEAVAPSRPLNNAPMSFQPMQSVPAEYYYGPQGQGGVQPAQGTTPGGAVPYQSPSSSTGNAMGHAPDYSWIRGKLERSHIGGGAWIVRYASPSEQDPYGGAVVLQGVDPTQYGIQPGAFVVVRGSIVENTAFPYLPNPGYRVLSIQPLR